MYKQGIPRYQTSPTVCNRTLNSIYFLNLSPINAFRFPSSMHQYIFVSSATYTVTIVAMTTTSCLYVIFPINRQFYPFFFRLVCE